MADKNSLELHSQEIANLSKTLVEGLPEIDEGNFVTHFLPILASSEPNVDLTPWLAVCGRSSVPVRVFRMVDGVKKYLYTVPALLDATGLTKTVYVHSRSMSHLISSAVATANSRPANMREKIVEQHLQRADVGASKSNEKAIAEWNYILRLYNYEPISDTLPENVDLNLLPKVESTKAAAKHQQHTSVVVEGYDDAW